MTHDDSAPDPRRLAPQTGAFEAVSPLIRRLIAPNPGPLTFTGTCVYVIGANKLALIDPGPAAPGHLDNLLRLIDPEKLTHIFVTHTHRDHSSAAKALAERTGARIFGAAPYEPPPGADPALRAAHDAAYLPDRVLQNGETVALDGFSLTAVATPGHAKNHLCFALAEEKALFSGDHVMAWSTSVIAPPDGDMSEYMASLELLRDREETIYWPGHGGPVTDPQRYLRALSHHRRQREEAILARLAAGDETIPEIVERIYDKLDANLRGAAALSVFSHLQDLTRRGLARTEGAPTLASRYFRRSP